MPRALLLILVVLPILAAPARPSEVAAQTTAPVRSEQVTFSTVVDWEGGLRDDLLISNNVDGELRLADGGTQGIFTSALISSTFALHAVGAVWNAETPTGTELEFELRGGTSPDDLGPWRSFAAGDARSQADDGAFATEAVLPFPDDTTYLQLRVNFSTTVVNASPVLSDITLTLFDATAGPSLSAGLPRVPAPYGPATLTTPPRIIQRTDWNAGLPAARIARQTPRGIILHQIGSDAVSDNPLPFMRAMTAFQTQVLGWDDTPYHFIVDSAGNIYGGHVGGPTAAVPRLAGGVSAIHIALIDDGAPGAAATEALASLIAWLGQAYAIAPLGEYTVVQDGEAVEWPNVAGHNQVVRAATDPSDAFVDAIDALRAAADAAMVRSRWYFAEGNAFDYAERLAVLNTSDRQASVRFNLLREPGPPVVRTVELAPGARADLVVNTIFSDTTTVPAIIESNAPVIAERFMDFGTDIAAAPGVTTPSRVWYFAEGSTSGERRTFLVLFNPQDDDAAATITYVQDDGRTFEQQVRVPAGRRLVVAVADALPESEFGIRVLATLPIIAERTMIFGPSNTLSSGGFHTTAGVVQLGRRWYFAEGTTQTPFQMRVLVLNPNAQSANVAVTFLTPDGTSLTRRYAIPATTRLTINVNEVVPELGVATTIDSDRPVAAERALYWADNSVGTVNAGATAPAFVWRFADGRTSGDFQQFLLFSNPSKNQALVTVDFILADGSTDAQSFVMPASSRYTMAVHQLYPGQQAIAAVARSTQRIVVERSLYPGTPGSAANRGGATAFGVPEVEP